MTPKLLLDWAWEEKLITFRGGKLLWGWKNLSYLYTLLGHLQLQVPNSEVFSCRRGSASVRKCFHAFHANPFVKLSLSFAEILTSRINAQFSWYACKRLWRYCLQSWGKIKLNSGATERFMRFFFSGRERFNFPQLPKAHSHHHYWKNNHFQTIQNVKRLDGTAKKQSQGEIL